MGKGIWLKPAKRDDPIYREGLTISTPRSARPKSSPKPAEKKPKAGYLPSDDSFDQEMTGEEAFERAMQVKLRDNRAWRASVASAQKSGNSETPPARNNSASKPSTPEK